MALLFLGLLLFLWGVVNVIYAPWFQDEARKAVVKIMNSKKGADFRLETFRLTPLLRLELGGLLWKQDGDTMVMAGSFRGNVLPLPLLNGVVDVDGAKLLHGAYNMGTVDSATMIRIAADSIVLHRATVRLKDMNISVDGGTVSDGDFSLWINPNPPRTAPKDTASAPLTVNVRNLHQLHLRYKMRMLPTIDSLGVTIADAMLDSAAINLTAQTVSVGSLSGHGLRASYIVPDAETIKNTVVAPPDTAVSKPWTVRVGKVYFDRSAGLYTTRGYKPLPGMDFGYISAGNMTVEVTDFYNCATTVRIPLSLTATERCGFTLSASGNIGIDAHGMTFGNFAVTTPAGTSLKAQGYLGMGDMATDPSVPVRLGASGDIAIADARLMFPAFKTYLAPLSAVATLKADLGVTGTIGALKVSRLNLTLPGVMTLRGSGQLNSVMNPRRMNGDITFSGSIGDVHPWVRMFIPTAGVTVPAMTVSGNLQFADGAYSGSLDASTKSGDIALDGNLHGSGPDYSLSLTARNFPVDAFLPGMGIGRLNGTVDADGHGFDPALPTTTANVKMDLADIVYQGQVYRDISGTAVLSAGHADLDLTSGNEDLDFTLRGSADISPRDYAVNASIKARNLALHKLRLAQSDALLAFDADVNATFNTALTDIAATLRLDRLTFTQPTGKFSIDNVTAHLNTTDSVINASVRNRDMYAYFSTPMGLKPFMARLEGVTPVYEGLLKNHSISVLALQQALPPFNLAVDGGSDNAITQMLAGAKMSLKSLEFSASNDSLLRAGGRVLGLRSETLRTDTIALDVHQSGDRLDYALLLDNRPGTFDTWAHARLGGFFDTNRLGLHLTQQNVQGKTGFNIGGNITLDGDSTATLRLDPLDPTIGYTPWTVNKDNFIVYNFRHRHLDADLHMSGDKSKLSIYTEHALSADSTMHDARENLIVDMSDIRIQDWLTLNPFATPMKGNLGARMSINWHDKTLTGNGNVSLTDFIYGKERVGDLKADIDVLTNARGLVTADVAMFVNGAKTMTLKGALNDSTRVTPLNLDFSMIHFPLATANAFVPGVARLNGYLNGSMEVSGNADRPRLDGWLEFEDATVRADMLGTTFTFPSERITVDSSQVVFDKFGIMGCNDRPLVIDGTVDISDLANAGVNLTLKADSMQVVKSNRAAKGAQVYGRAFVTLDASARGNMKFMTVRANAGILPGTNVTYIMQDAQSVIENRGQDQMVKFVNFSDSSAVAVADSVMPPSTMLLDLAATLRISSGTVINVDLGSGSSNKVQLRADGSLSYSSSPITPARMTGRININGGFVNFAPPMMSEKNFAFNEGSYVSFSGNMMNPLLNIHATDRVRANVTTQGQNSRLIYFNVLLGVTGTLQNMDVAFDLATDDDATVANELATMSPTQRASSAMNLLITNMYSSGETKADSNMSDNALYSFLTSRLNSWAANTIRGVDLSFGINQYDNVRSGASTQTTQYSYRVSKSLFNDRFKIVVGGNYSTDADADENLEQNLISDVSFEYLLNPQGTMVIRIFRHTGFESILEGEITQTGVGFTCRRKMGSLRDLFRWLYPRRAKSDTTATQPLKTDDND